jgi:hypothetical protein
MPFMTGQHCGHRGVLIAGVMVLPTLAGALLPASLDSVLQFLPSSAAAAFTTVTGAGDSVVGATAGALVLAAWVASLSAPPSWPSPVATSNPAQAAGSSGPPHSTSGVDGARASDQITQSA